MRHFPSRQKKSSPTAAVIAAFRVPEIKKQKMSVKLEGISRTMTQDYEKKLKSNKMAEF